MDRPTDNAGLLGKVRRVPVKLYQVTLLRELSSDLEAYAAEARVKPETVIAEAVRSYLGVDA